MSRQAPFQIHKAEISAKMNTPGTGVSGYALLLSIQFIFLVLFGLYTDYDVDLQPKNGTQADEGFVIPKYARKNDWIEASRDLLFSFIV